MMSNLKLPALLLALPLVLRCVIAAPNSRYAILSNAQPERVGWQTSEISKHPFSSRAGALPQAGLTAFSGHQIQKRKCNTATCVTQRLADFLVRSSNTLGPLYAPTNVGSNTYGKRDHLQPTSYLPL